MRESWKNSSVALLLSAAALLLLGAAPLTGGESKEERDVIEKLQKSYDSAVDFGADFRQETELKTLGRSLKAGGRLFFKRPGRMLWRYDQPKGQFVLADGKNLYYYQPEQGQVLKSPLKDAFHSAIPLSFLLGIGDLRKDFQVNLKRIDPNSYTLRLEPKARLGGVGEIELAIDHGTFEILWARIQDGAGNATTIHFSNMRRGIGLKDSLFHLKVPDGVDVVEMGQ